MKLEGIRAFFRRNNIVISFVIIAATFMLILFVQTLALSRLQEQIQGQKQLIKQIQGVTSQISKSSQQRTAQIDQLNQHIDCIFNFFTQPDRNNKSISDGDSCEVTDNAASGTSGSSGHAMATSNTAQGKSTTSGAAQGSSSTDSSSDKDDAPTAQPNILKRILSPITNLLGGL